MDYEAHYNRVTHLIGQSRFALAEAELRKALVDDPDGGDTHALLAICLAEQGKLTEAEEEANLAIGLAPDDSFSFYSLARVASEREHWNKAEKAIRQAIEIETDDEDQFSLLATILLNLNKFQQALEAAEEGLAIDPENVDCMNIRVLALRRLDRGEDVSQALDEALQQDPEDEMTHFNLGWSYIEDGDRDKALEHFREALRLDPEFDAAREGVLEVLRSRNPVYRWVLGHMLWMSKRKASTQWIIVIGILVAFITADRYAGANAAVGMWLQPLIYFVCGFALLLWIPDPVFNLLLRFSPQGRTVLTEEELQETNWTATFLVPATFFLILAIALANNGFFLRAMVLATMVVYVAAVYDCEVPWARKRMVMFSIGMCLLGAISILILTWAAWLPTEGRASTLRSGRQIGIAFILGAVFADDVANWLKKKAPHR